MCEAADKCTGHSAGARIYDKANATLSSVLVMQLVYSADITSWCGSGEPERKRKRIESFRQGAVYFSQSNDQVRGRATSELSLTGFWGPPSCSDLLPASQMHARGCINGVAERKRLRFDLL